MLPHQTFARSSTRHAACFMTTNADAVAARSSRLLAAKEAAGLSFDQLAVSLGLTNTYTAQLFLGQAQLKPTTAPKLKAALPTINDDDLAAMVAHFPMRGFDEKILQEPNVYRTYEAITHYGEAIKRLINEQCGDGAKCRTRTPSTSRTDLHPMFYHMVSRSASFVPTSNSPPLASGTDSLVYQPTLSSGRVRSNAILPVDSHILPRRSSHGHTDYCGAISYTDILLNADIAIPVQRAIRCRNLPYPETPLLTHFGCLEAATACDSCHHWHVTMSAYIP